MTPMKHVLKALQQLEKQFPQPTKPSDKPTYNDGAAFVIQELLPQVEAGVEAEKEMVIQSCLWGKVEACNIMDANEYYNKISQ